MGSCVATFKADLDGPVVWYPGNGPESLQWVCKEEGFGYRRVHSYKDIAIEDSGYNRNGNHKGELAGKIVFYTHADPSTNYSKLPENPTFDLKDGQKLFAKAFFDVPLGRIPIGENNIIANRDKFRGQGAVLLASRPRTIALFVNVNKVQQAAKHFCADSKAEYDTEMSSMTMEPKPIVKDEAMPGSFFTFLCSKMQEPYCFLHLPLIGTLTDTGFRTGTYGESMIRAFCDLFASLSPGKHQIDMKVRYYYDHCDYNCLVLGDGTNAMGRWYKCVPNSLLKSPHDIPEVIESPAVPIACGSFIVNLTEKYDTSLILDQLDWKAPLELYYRGNAHHLRNIAKTVAAGRCCEELGLRGLPDWVILTSDLEVRVVNSPELVLGKHTYEAMDFVALWYGDSRKPEAPGWLVEGSMACGEIEPHVVHDDWVWTPRLRNDQPLPLRRRPIKNKHINMAARGGRRISIVTAAGKIELSDWMKQMEESDKVQVTEIN